LDVISENGDPLPQDRLDFVHAHAGDKPLINLIFYVANPDSAMWRYPNYNGVQGYSTQPARGAGYWNTLLATTDPPGLVAAAYTATRTNPYIGTLWWKYLDTPGEHDNWGIVTLSDNAYDGHEAVYTNSSYSRTIACSAPLSTYRCGGEERSYGNFIGRAASANSNALLTFCRSLGGCH
jgi:hypothetical protein